jgi:CHAD domain-containing protein
LIRLVNLPEDFEFLNAPWKDAMQAPEPAGQNPPNPGIERLTRLMRKRLKKFITLVPELMLGEEPAAVHDARVSSRRLQQGLAALFPKPRPGKVRRVRKTLRWLRRLLGEWRDCDVELELVAQEHRRTRSPVKRQAWKLVQDHLLEKREHLMAQAREKLLKYDLKDFAGNVQKLLDRPPPNENWEALRTHWHAAVDTAWTQWYAALAQAQETRSAGDIHQFRIATKRLRYRVELAHEMGDKEIAPLLDELKQLQDTVGLWHDRQELYGVMAEAMSRPQLLLGESRKVRLLLSEIEKDRLRQRRALDEILRLASEGPARKQPGGSAGESSEG